MKKSIPYKHYNHKVLWIILVSDIQKVMLYFFHHDFFKV